MEVYRSKYQIIWFDDDNSIIINKLTEQTVDFEEDIYKEEILAYTAILKKYRPIYVLTDLIDYDYPIVPNLQDWHAQTVFPVVDEIGIKKAAMVLPQDVFSQISAQQTLDTSYEDYHFAIEYFEDISKAQAWLLTP